LSNIVDGDTWVMRMMLDGIISDDHELLIEVAKRNGLR
jgi:hypothetical protein